LAQRGLADRQSLIEHASAAERAGAYRTRFVVLRGSAYSFVPVKDVDWIDVADNYLQLHVGTRTHLSRGTMKQAEDELDPSVFIRVHRSHLVAIEQIETIRAHESGGFILKLRSGSVVRASRQYAERVRGLLGSR
jgi:two-component system LytT family response regulator